MKGLDRNALVLMASLTTACSGLTEEDVFPKKEKSLAEQEAEQCDVAMDLVDERIGKSMAYVEAVFQAGEVVSKEDIVFPEGEGSDLFDNVFGVDPDADESDIVALDGGADAAVRLVQCRLKTKDTVSGPELSGECVGKKAYPAVDGKLRISDIGDGPSPLPEDDEPGWFDDKDPNLLYVDDDNVSLDGKYTLEHIPGFNPQAPLHVSRGGCTVTPPFTVHPYTGYPNLHQFEPVSRCAPVNCNARFEANRARVRQLVGRAVSGALRGGGKR